MTEHPNYKYRPRRRKHNKQRSPAGPGQRVGTSLPSPGLPNMSPRYSGYIPNTSLSPNIQQSTFASMEFPSPGGSNSADYSGEKRFSPDNFRFTNQLGYVGYQNYAQKSPYSMQSSETSPTNSPEPKNSKPPGSPPDHKEVILEKGSSLPTPAVSPLEREKDKYQQFEEKLNTIQHNISSSIANSINDMNPVQQAYNNSRIQNYRQPTTIYTNAHPITSVPMSNGLYVMCTSKSGVEQGHVVTGTFYPPVATSQDQQVLGSTHNSLSIASTSNPTHLHYYDSNISSYYGKEYSHYEQQDPNKESFLNYQQMKMLEKTNYLAAYKPQAMEDPYQEYSAHADTNQQLVQNFVHTTAEERSDVESDVDTREFDKYLKFSSIDSNIIDSNHNYHRNESTSANSTYNFQAQHTSVILPNTNNVKPEPFVHPHCTEVYDMAANGVQKSEDDFSEILAGVRKTCFST